MIEIANFSVFNFQDKTKIKLINSKLIDEKKTLVDVSTYSDDLIADMLSKKLIYEETPSSSSVPANQRIYYRNVQEYSKIKIGLELFQYQVWSHVIFLIFTKALKQRLGQLTFYSISKQCISSEIEE